jgi:hypothetical protein
MIKVFGYLKRKPGLSLQEFADYGELGARPQLAARTTW